MSEQGAPITWRNRDYPDWDAVIAEAQTFPGIVIEGATLGRVPYGTETEDFDAATFACFDCGVSESQLHVSLCDMEECPSCHGQLLSCPHRHGVLRKGG